MRRLLSTLQSVTADGWVSFQTLNNKVVFCRPASVKAFTFLDEAEDDIEGDWQVGPADIYGWPMEVYECLEQSMYEADGIRADDQFSDKLIQIANEIIDEHSLDDEKLKEMCIDTRIIYADGTSSLLYCSSDRLADVVSEIEFGSELGQSAMLHFDDKNGDHDVLISAGLVALMEFPLILLKRGLEELDAEYSSDCGKHMG